MSGYRNIALGQIMASKLGSVDPSKFTEEIFDLYSIPAFDSRKPEVVVGAKIGSVKQIVQPGDVLLSKIVPHIRRAWIVGENQGRRIIASSEWIVFRGGQVEPRYLRHVIVSDMFHAQFMQTVSGVGGSLLRARPAQVASIEIALPSLEEQRRIAEILECAEELRSKRREAIAQLDTLTQAIFLEMFGEPLHSQKGIKNVCLSEVTIKITDGTHITPKFTNTGIPFIFVKNIKNGEIDFQTDKFISQEEHHKLYKRCPVEEGDILYTTVGATYGQAAPVRNFTKFAFQRHIAHLKPDKNKILTQFLSTIMQLPFVKSQADRWARGAAQPTINLKELREFVIPLPAIHLQHEFARRVEAVEKLKAAHHASLSELDALFASLQHRAFRGEL